MIECRSSDARRIARSGSYVTPVRRRRLAHATILALAIAAFTTTGCRRANEGDAEFGAQAAVPVLVSKVTRRSIAQKIHAIGRVEAYSTVDIKAQVSGQLDKVHFEEGQFVKKGDVLFTLDPRPFDAALKQADAALTRNQAQLVQADADEKRQQFLLDQGVGSPQQFDQAHAQAEALRAEVASGRAAVDAAKLNLAYTTIRAPIDGRTGDLLVHAGNLVKANADDPMVIVNQIKPIYVSFSVPEKDLAEIRSHLDSRKLPVEAMLPGNSQQWERGELSFIDNRVNPDTGTIMLKGVFTNEDERLWPGQFIDAYLTLGERPDLLVVPSQAVQTGQDGAFVFVVDKQMKAQPRTVVVGQTIDGQTVVERGIKPGETVVTDGQLRLMPGSTVTVKTPLKPSAAIQP
ncbi:MAG: efflux RND transporter periplasmic adaptor subunit [Candidatus Binataceae bacterium]